ncbi:MAG: DUF3291 domain-containing protein [Paracoccaceae bacterium]
MSATHLAQLNVGRLRAPIGDPRVAEFIDNVDRVNAAGKRMPGFVWMLEGDAGPGNTEHKIDGDPRFISNLTVWESVEALEAFVWGTVHKRFYERRALWFEALAEAHFVMWWVAAGHRPTLAEGLDRLARLREHGPSEHAFGWKDLPEARLWREARCGEVTA